MNHKSIKKGINVNIHPLSLESLNYVDIGDNAKISKRCSVFGSPNHILFIGKGTHIHMNTLLEGYEADLRIGEYVSVAPNVLMLTGSGPDASQLLQNIYPIVCGPIVIGNHCWIGANVTIMPNVTLGDCCVVAANSYVNESFPAYSIIGGTPAKLIRRMSDEEICKLNAQFVDN